MEHDRRRRAIEFGSSEPSGTLRAPGNALARMLVGAADVDQHGALIDEALGLVGR